VWNRDHSFGARRFRPRLPTSHGALVERNSIRLAASSDRMEAIIVPASRGPAALGGAAHLAVRLRVPLVALCSGRARAAEAAAFLDAWRGLQTLVTDVPAGYRHEFLPIGTAPVEFGQAAGGRQSDLAVKRNLGLLIARHLGWGKILFLDDDIGRTGGTEPAIAPWDVSLLAAQLNVRRIAGFTCRAFPDNSVVHHARRLAGFRQGNFVTGAALGVNCYDQPIPFFPDQYNEDWFFVSELAAERSLGYVGDVPQAAYDPFARSGRAQEEEFGDLLAEGLFYLFEHQPTGMDYESRLAAAGIAYWDWYRSQRYAQHEDTRTELAAGLGGDFTSVARRLAAINSINAAIDQLERVTPEDCVRFISAWRSDLQQWKMQTQRIHPIGEMAATMDILQLTEWFTSGLAHGTVEPDTTSRVFA
jgi:hypothetical protein